MCEVIPLLPLYALIARTGTTSLRLVYQTRMEHLYGRGGHLDELQKSHFNRQIWQEPCISKIK
jgi:hypothetical protein